jgi:hypothetical protein
MHKIITKSTFPCPIRRFGVELLIDRLFSLFINLVDNNLMTDTFFNSYFYLSILNIYLILGNIGGKDSKFNCFLFLKLVLEKCIYYNRDIIMLSWYDDGSLSVFVSSHTN